MQSTREQRENSGSSDSATAFEGKFEFTKRRASEQREGKNMRAKRGSGNS